MLTISSGDLVFYDFFQIPPVPVRLACNSMRDAVQRPEISDSDCQLPAMRHEPILTAVAAMIFEKGKARSAKTGASELTRFSRSNYERLPINFLPTRYKFPEVCPDGAGPCGCDFRKFDAISRAPRSPSFRPVGAGLE